MVTLVKVENPLILLHTNSKHDLAPVTCMMAVPAAMSRINVDKGELRSRGRNLYTCMYQAVTIVINNKQLTLA